MSKNLPKLAVNILTFKTDLRILKNCIDSIDKSIPINIIENSNNFKEVIGGDKGSNTKMYLINRNKYKNNFKVYKV